MIIVRGIRANAQGKKAAQRFQVGEPGSTDQLPVQNLPAMANLYRECGPFGHIEAMTSIRSHRYTHHADGSGSDHSVTAKKNHRHTLSDKR